MLVEQVRQLIQTQQLWQANERVLVAVSTGVDSMVLLDILEQLSVPMGVVYVNHCLREVSYEEEAFLIAYCQDKQLPLYHTRWDEPATTGVEAAAREFRYTFFKEVLAKENYDVLVTAHHSDDQIETILMKMVREGNFFSSRGIQLTQSFGTGRLVRPLLETTKADILAYSQERQIPFFEDETNQSLAMQRNRLRHQVIPLLKKENPQVSQHFQQWSQQMDWAQELIREQQQTWITQYVQKTGMQLQFQWSTYLKMSPAQRYFFLQGLGVPLSEKQCQQLMKLLDEKTAQWHVDLAGWQVQKSYEQVVFRPTVTKKLPSMSERTLRIGDTCYLSDDEWIGFFLKDDIKIPKKVKLWSEYRQELSVEFPIECCLRKRQPGDKIALQPHISKKISRYFIDQKIPNQQRENAWVVTDCQGIVLGLLPYVFSYLSIAKETDKIHYVLLYRRREEADK
ncbi:tRNA lysidine(34) synthetase TilS [Enterococcus saccharolyticus]|uniref:tRNA(Ile)-lysidine synthase n=1 Tax=Candidatus Enterococcus willemsii TaxID=1857215 RepID=A0ABQ6YZY8_9ENTE|nr:MULTISPECIES: tRNA lysidine(34) synthetase TilS [Enterococcus]KAF1304189.1 tRNA lysidine(34) synthetase TilS [Enterococcus sp. CU12B]MCD5001936.1 tRNA lysidine(34) synthetase TilS [Enterococcus saccharolyticus]